MRVISNEVIRVGNLVHVHHNQNDTPRWGYVHRFFSENSILVNVEVTMADGRPSLTVEPCYLNKALLGLDGPHCLRCEREARLP